MKTIYTEKQINDIIKKIYPNATKIYNMVEGLTSQTYCFSNFENKLVIQISKNMEGYKKDEYIYNTYFSKINVRKIISIGNIENDISYCISEFINAKRLQDLSKNEFIRNLNTIMKIFETLKNIFVETGRGYGFFNSNGIGLYNSWTEFVNAIYDNKNYVWNNIVNSTKELVFRCIYEIKRHNNLLENKRNLIHGDFGSSNVLYGNEEVYVIDWDIALYGDPLYELANVLFWNEKCLQPLINELKQKHIKNKKTKLKIYVYILRIGLEEIYRTIEDNKIGYDIRWAQNRLVEIINEYGGSANST